LGNSGRLSTEPGRYTSAGTIWFANNLHQPLVLTRQGSWLTMIYRTKGGSKRLP